MTGRGDKRRKSSAVGKNESSDGMDVNTALVDIEQLPKERHSAAMALSKIVTDGIRDRSKAG